MKRASLITLLTRLSRLVPAVIGVMVVGLVMGGIAYAHSHTFAVLQPRGPVADGQRQLIILASLLALIVVLPVFGLLFGFAWKYRATNKRARYSPELDGNRLAETIWWLIPGVLIAVLSVVTWRSTHALDPYRPLNSAIEPVNVQVVALQWRWLFIYPDDHLACLNRLMLPTGTPLNLQITADAPMNSFWIPQLGGQVYAMTGMTTQLHLLADRPGDYQGRSANLSGSGFSGMTFTARARSPGDYQAWRRQLAADGTAPVLDQAAYRKLAEPSRDTGPRCFRGVAAGLYNTVMAPYMAPATRSGNNGVDIITNPATQAQQPPDGMQHMDMHE